MINATTTICCVLGDPVEQSKSPVMHNAAYKELGHNYSFVAFKPTSIKHAVEAIRTLGIRGAAVTIPFKEKLIEYVDQVDETALEIGAANTIVNDEGILTAYNTDWIGAMTALRQKTIIAGKKVAVLGAGGAARAIVYGLVKEQASEIHVYNRTHTDAELLVRKFGLTQAHTLDDLSLLKNTDIIINTTPVGMYPHAGNSAIPASALENHHSVFDIVYNPKETQLLKDAKKAGATVVYGYTMLLHGGATQFELFTREKPPIEVMEKALLTSV